MAGNIFQELYTIADTAIVGRIMGVDALAALGAVSWNVWFFLGTIQGMTQGFSILIAQSLSYPSFTFHLKYRVLEGSMSEYCFAACLLLWLIIYFPQSCGPLGIPRIPYMQWYWLHVRILPWIFFLS